MSDLTIVRKSTTNLRIRCFSDQAKTIAKDLRGMTLEFIAKTSMSDTDANAVFVKTGESIVVEGDEFNECVVYITSADTATLPVAKDRSLYCELVSVVGDRETIGQVVIPVRASVKQT